MQDFLKFVVYGGLFLVPFLTLYVANDYFFPYITGKNFYFRIIIEIVFASWFILCLYDAKYRPKFSWILSSFGLLLIVMFFANFFGRHPQTSFWSNFERMDGYVTLVHVFLYSLVLGSVLTTKKVWSWYLHTTLAAAVITALYGVTQFYGTGDLAGRRIESFLGNAAYLSIYMLFHIFITFWLLVESKVTLHKVLYIFSLILFIFVLLNSSTRGTVLGLVSGVGVMVTYIMFFGAKYKEFRSYAIGAFIFLAIGVGTLLLARDSSFVQNNPNIARIANINLSEDLKVRATIWGMAWEGVKERPVLGWGQENFNYVFNEKYEPFLFDQEQWFDRAHNIILDWLIAGGFLGLIAYLGIFASCIYYLLILPFFRKDDETFTVLERGVLLGLLVGYFTHNLVVFDNIVSYIFFGLILALIHSRSAQVLPKINNVKVDRSLTQRVIAPVVLVVTLITVYLVNVPGMNAAQYIIDGYRSTTPEARLEFFETAISQDSFAHQEITEQVSQQAMMMVNDPNIKVEIRQRYIDLAETQLIKLMEDKPGDARIHSLAGIFYWTVGDLNQAATQMAEARRLSPKKPSIILQQAILAYRQDNLEQARDWFREAFELDERNSKAREYYAAILFLTESNDKAIALTENEEMFGLVNILRDFGQIRPDFLVKANCIADNIEADRPVEEGC